MTEMISEHDLVARFREDSEVKVPIDTAEGESFSASLDRIARHVMDIMQRYDLYSEAEGKLGEWVISNVQQDEELGWVYSVRIQRDDE